MTISDAFAAAMPVAEVGGKADPAPRATPARARMRARGYRSPAVTGKAAGLVVDRARRVGADIRSAWWAPESLPTLSGAWADRIPDREKVPGGNAVLYGGWVVYNHTVRLAGTAAAVALVGLLAVLTWALQHPARLALLVLISGAVAGLIYN